MLNLPLTFLQRPAASTTPRPWLLVLMHGVGSNEQDLFSLAPQIPERFHVLSLRAPFRMGPGAHAWFDFSIEPGSERTINEEQEAQSRALVAQAIAHHMAPLPVTVTYHEFPSAHEIRPSELAATVAWLESLSTTPTAF